MAWIVGRWCGVWQRCVVKSVRACVGRPDEVVRWFWVWVSVWRDFRLGFGRDADASRTGDFGGLLVLRRGVAASLELWPNRFAGVKLWWREEVLPWRVEVEG